MVAKNFIMILWLAVNENSHVVWLVSANCQQEIAETSEEICLYYSTKTAKNSIEPA
jgi:hypothetical protein